MADKSKSERLAAAKRLVREFKTKQHKDSAQQHADAIDQNLHPPEPATTPPMPDNNTAVHEQISIAENTRGNVAPTSSANNFFNSFTAAFSQVVSADAFSTPAPSELEISEKPQTPQFNLFSQVSQQIGSMPLSDSIAGPNTPALEISTDELNLEKQRNQELVVQLLNRNSYIEELRNEIQKLKVDNSTKVTMEIGPLEEQLQSHVQTIGVLVGEKAELAAALNKFQGLAKIKISEVEELQGRLNASRHRVQELEKEITAVKMSHEKYDGTQQRLCTELESCQDEMRRIKKNLEDAVEEIAELKQKLSVKNRDIDRLEAELTSTKSELNLSHLRIEQFAAGDSIESDSKLEKLAQQKLFFEQQSRELQEMVQQLGAERDQANQQYQNYVQQLNKETTNLAQQLQEYVAENERLAKREEGLVRHVGDLEKQIQQQISKQKNFKDAAKESGGSATTTINADIVPSLELKCEHLESAKSQLEKQLQEKELQLSGLQSQYQQSQDHLADLESMVERLRIETPDSKSLIASIESDKVAASRAVLQNQDLKQQLEEIQRAFVQISNDKLELTDRLQSEQHLGRENKIKASTLDAEVAAIRQKLHYKDEEMIRLTHENEELNKNILQLSQELDRLRHYEAKGQANNVLQQQLQNANESIRKLRSRVKELESHTSVPDVAEGAEVSEHTDLLSSSTNDQPIESVESNDTLDHMSVSSTINIPTEEAMNKLQERFTRTMSEIADLTEEKMRLEHLVMQLQGETETIGEYIALYQNQRRLLKQREVEKDVQLSQIISDREEMKVKLQQLNALVEQLLVQKGATTLTPVDSNEHAHNQSVAGTNEPQSDKQLHTNGIIVMETNGNDSNQSHIPPQKSIDTASKILNLLSEIQDKNQNQKFDTPIPDIHNCAYCYGKLETV